MSHPPPRRLISVIGAGVADGPLHEWAQETGRLLAERGAVVVTGGLGGVMEAASRGAAEAGGLTIGILPGCDTQDANPWVQVALPTGLGDARNVLVATAGLGVIAIGGAVGTLSEIALALKRGLPVVTLNSWHLDSARTGHGRRLLAASTPAEAVEVLFVELDADAQE